MRTRFLLVLVGALCALSLAPAAANAYRYAVDVEEEHFSVNDLNPALSSTVRATRAGVEVMSSRSDEASGQTYAHVDADSLLPGDVIEVYQPQTGNPVNSAPVATFTIPNFSVSVTPPSPTVSGSAPDGWTVYVTRRAPCSGPAEVRSMIAAAGAYAATFSAPAQPRADYTALATSPSGDVLGTTIDPLFDLISSDGLEYVVPGDGGCLTVDASLRFAAPAEPVPYRAEVWGLDYDAIPTVRLLIRRGGVPLADEMDSGMYLTRAQKPLPGDVIEVYRPKDAATPAYSWTIPPIGGVFDPGNDLVGITAPPASSLEVRACRPIVCPESSYRSLFDAPAGRTIFNFAQPLNYDRAFDLLAADSVSGTWISPDLKQEYGFDMPTGDLTSPIGRISLSKSTGASKLKKSGKLKFKLTSSEAGSVVSTLTIPAKKKKGSKKAKKPLKLGSGKGAVKAGTNKLSLKLSRSGKKVLKRTIRSGKSRKATLTITLTDTAGNVTTVVKSTTIKVKRRRR